MKRWLLFFAVAMSVAASFAGASALGERALAWTQVGSHEGHAPDWDAVAERASKAGLTDLMVLLSMNDGAYFGSTVTPVRVNFVKAFGDQLSKCVAACHRRGIKCHAWRYAWIVMGKGEALRKFESEGRFQVRRGDFQGPLWLCPNDPRNRQQEVDAFLELAASGVDGIHMDHIRYDGDCGCYCERCRRLFESRLGRPVGNWPEDVVAKGALNGQWDDFRRKSIDSLVEEIALRVKKDFPGVEVSAAVQPFSYSGKCAQDWPLWCAKGWVDFVCPMDYRNDCEALKKAALPQKTAMDEVGVPVYPGIGVLSGMSKLDAAETKRQVETVLGMGFPGCAFFSFHRDSYAVFDGIAGIGDAQIEPPALDMVLDGKLSGVREGFRLETDGTYTVATSFSAIFPRSGGTRGIVLSFGSGWFDGFRMCIQPMDGGYSVAIEIAQEPKEKQDAPVLQLLDGKRSFRENEAVAFSASWDGRTVRMFVNGKEVASCRHERPFVHPQSNRVMFGKGGFGLPYHPIRPMRARIWRRALSGDEIRAVAEEDLKSASAKFDSGSSSALRQLLSMCDENDIVCAELEERLAFALLKEGDADNAKEHFQKTLNRKKASPYDARLEFCERWADALEASGRCQLAEDIRKKASDEADEVLKKAFVPPVVWTASANDVAAGTPDTFFYVSPEGNDGNAGTKDFPFATVARAQQAVRKLKEEGKFPKCGVCVYLMGGRYPLRSPLVFEEADSGMPGAPVVWKGYPGERPVFDGGWRVPEMTKVTDREALSRIPAKARGNVLCCNVRAAGYRHCEAPSPYGVGSKACRRAITDLYADGVWMQPARYPNEGFLRAECGGIGSFSVQKGIAEAFANENDLLATGFWKHLWLDATVKVRGAEDGSGRFNVVEPRGFDMSSAPGKPYFLCNALCALDREGEWYLDSKTGILYFWPPENSREVVLSGYSGVFLRIEKLHDAVFEGIVFENGRLDAVEMRSCANVEFRKNIVRNFGRHGITATGARKVRIVNNAIAGFGGRAIHVSGGERKTLTPAENVISDNEIASVERRERTYMPGLSVEGCGMDVARNHFHDMPSSAIRIEGNDYRVVSNLIERVVTESDDQGGIDIYRDPSYAGVFIAYNRFRDIGSPPGADGFASCGQAAVRLDGNVSGMVVYSNVFERCGRSAFGAVQVNGGRNNRIEGNRFVDCWSGVSISYFSPMKWKAVMKDLRKLYEERVDIRSPPYSTKYPGIATLDEQTIQTNFVVRNVLVRTENLVSTRSPDVLVYGNTVAYPPEPVSALSEIKNLPYDRSGRETSTGDLFLPTVVSRSSKVILVIHGGSWSSMSRHDVAGVAEFFRDRLGFAAFNIDYRLASGKNRWPACGEDCVQAAKWLLSEDFTKVSGIRADKIWICGLSAGGHLALWTLNALPSNAVAGVVAISPIGDPKVDFADHPSRYTRLLGDDAEFRLEEMDPCRNVGKKQAPVLITHSREDRVVRIGSSRRFAEAYRNMGGVCQMYEYAGEDEANRGGHAIWRAGVKPGKLLSHIELRIIDFIAGY